MHIIDILLVIIKKKKKKNEEIFNFYTFLNPTYYLFVSAFKAQKFCFQKSQPKNSVWLV